jgi:lysozyme
MTDVSSASAPAVSPITPRVVDVFHGDIFASEVKRSPSLLSDFQALASSGIWGMIHKATQGAGVTDHMYGVRTQVARIAGLETGAYHFNTSDPIPSQVEHFFDAAQPDAKTLMALDFEDNRASQMSLSQAVQFLQLADEKLGRPLWLYSGNRIKELIVNASDEVRTTFAKRRFWLCEYGPVARMTDVNGHALPWDKWTLWQATGDGIGQQPHALPGIVTRGIDINWFAGSRDELAAAWPG